jgi:hypothetical protein
VPDDHDLVLVCGGVRLVLTPRKLLALQDIIAAQIACDDVELPERRPVLRVLGADGTIEHPIACEYRVAAQIDERNPPICRWGPRTDAFGCTLCGTVIERGDDRFPTLAGLFGGDGLSERERKVVAAVLRALASKAPAAGLERFAAGLLELEPDAVAIVRAAVLEVERG